jgi:uncharacterized protein YhdP
MYQTSYISMGVVTAEGLRQASELGVFSQLAMRANGSTSYNASVGLRKGQPEIFVQSDLKGMALTFPAPMNKPACSDLAFAFGDTTHQRVSSP